MSSFKNRLNIKGDCFTFFKMSLNSTHNHIEDNETERLIIASISTLKRSSKKCGRNKVFDQVQTSLDTDISRKIFDEVLQNMVESNAVKWRTFGDRECLSLLYSISTLISKKEAEDADAIENRTKSDLEVFQLQLDKFKSSFYEQFSSFKRSFITEISQFKSDFLCKKSNRNDENTTEKEITFLHEELKSKNTIITLSLENVLKLKIIITMKTEVSIQIMTSKLLSQKKISLEQRNQLKQRKQKSRQQNH